MKLEAEGPERLVDRMRWFRQGRLDAGGEIPSMPAIARFKQMGENIRRGILRAQPATLTPGELVSGRPVAARRPGQHVQRPHYCDRGPSQRRQHGVRRRRSGGVWKTTDHGATWTPLTDTQASLAVGSIAIDPPEPERRLCRDGRGEQLLRQLLRRGDPEIHRRRVDVDAHRRGRVRPEQHQPDHRPSHRLEHPVGYGHATARADSSAYDATAGGAHGRLEVDRWRSDLDACAEWKHPRPRSSIRRTPTLFTPASTTDGIWKSTDGGSNWTRLSVGLPLPAGDRSRGDRDPPRRRRRRLYAVFASYLERALRSEEPTGPTTAGRRGPCCRRSPPARVSTGASRTSARTPGAQAASAGTTW